MANIEIVLNIPEELWDFISPSLCIYRTNAPSIKDIRNTVVDWGYIKTHTSVRCLNRLKDYVSGYSITVGQILDMDLSRLGRITAMEVEHLKTLLRLKYAI